MYKDKYEEQIAACETLIKELKEARASEIEERKASVKLEWVYTITPSERPYQKSWDDTLRWYYLEGHVANKAEAETVGHTFGGFDGQGGMAYLFNTATTRIVMNGGGGQLHIESFGGDEENEARTRESLEYFLTDNPEGGDITFIVEAHKRNRSAT